MSNKLNELTALKAKLGDAEGSYDDACEKVDTLIPAYKQLVDEGRATDVHTKKLTQVKGSKTRAKNKVSKIKAEIEKLEKSIAESGGVADDVIDDEDLKELVKPLTEDKKEKAALTAEPFTIPTELMTPDEPKTEPVPEVVPTIKEKVVDTVKPDVIPDSKPSITMEPDVEEKAPAHQQKQLSPFALWVRDDLSKMLVKGFTPLTICSRMAHHFGFECTVKQRNQLVAEATEKHDIVMDQFHHIYKRLSK